MTDTTTAPPVITGGRETKAKRTVILALIVGAGMASTNRAMGGDRPRPQILAAGLVAAVGLTVAAEIAPRPAAAVALLMLTAAIVDTGPQLWAQIRDDVIAT